MDEQRDDRVLISASDSDLPDDPLARIAGLDAEPVITETSPEADAGEPAVTEQISDDADANNRESASDAESAEAMPAVAERKPSLMQRFRAWLPGETGKRAELLNLTDAIASFPNAPSNYVMRGELYLKLGHYAEARADFHQALTLASQEFADANWGLIAQSLQDRAVAGLREIDSRFDIVEGGS